MALEARQSDLNLLRSSEYRDVLFPVDGKTILMSTSSDSKPKRSDQDAASASSQSTLQCDDLGALPPEGHCERMAPENLVISEDMTKTKGPNVTLSDRIFSNKSANAATIGSSVMAFFLFLASLFQFSVTRSLQQKALDAEADYRGIQLMSEYYKADASCQVEKVSGDQQSLMCKDLPWDIAEALHSLGKEWKETAAVILRDNPTPPSTCITYDEEFRDFVNETLSIKVCR